MSIDSDKPLLAFENLWVYGRRAVSMSDNEATTGTRANAFTLQKIYQNWSDKLKNNTTPDDRTTHNSALISGASGELHSGQITVLTGASGSGKSVLLRVLAGLLPMSAGDILLQSSSAPIGSNSIEIIEPTEWRKQVALLAQHPQLMEGRVLDNLKMPYQLQAHQSKSFDIDWHVAQLETLNRNAEFLQQEAYHLSGGERQLVNTLRLLQLNPRVLLLDEPTAALDVDTSAQLVTLLMSWLQANKQRTLLWVTHDTKDIMPLANRHWQMQAGVLTEIS